MRIALCLSGQPRFVDECAPYILKNIIEGYKVDVFCHFWFDSKLQNEPYKFGECGKGEWHKQRIQSNAIEKVIELYNPVSLKTEDSRSFIDSNVPFQSSLERYFYGALNDPDKEGFRSRAINNSISYMYSLNEVQKLKKLYELANDFKYDWVVKCRTDTLIHTKLSFEQYNPDVINYSFHQNQPDGMVNDWLDFGGSRQMDIFMSIFSVWHLILDKCMNETGAWCNELMHRKILDLYNIKTQGHPINLSLPRF